MRGKKVLVTLAVCGSLLGTAGTAVAAPDATSQSAAGPGTRYCGLYDFIGFACGYYDGSRYTDYGDRGAHVKEIQALLTYFGYSVGRSGIDGQFGADTRSAVRAFQRHNRIGVDGIVGPDTWWHLRTP
ncbi:peptidoglycan-binding domain-containing protein [Streptomyces coelicoflavus]|uniref:peptidoglycan-binding domain-containing protein n=1 Tax=Streptomyces coelicoflavus TaxID=285562 RepID=UPI002E25E9A3